MDFFEHVAIAPLLRVGAGEVAAEDRAAGFQSGQRRFDFGRPDSQPRRKLRRSHRTRSLERAPD